MSTVSQSSNPLSRTTTAQWSSALADAGGRNSLIWGAAPGLSLDLVSAHPGGVAKLLSGHRVLLSDLVRAPGPRERVLPVVSALVDRAEEMESDWGLPTCFATSGTATWEVAGTRSPAAPVVLRPVSAVFADDSRTEVELELAGIPEVNPALLRFLRVSHGVDLDPVVLAEMVDRLHARTDEPLLRHLEMLCRTVPGFSVRSGQRLSALTYSKDAGIADLADLADSPSRLLSLMASASVGRPGNPVAPHLPQVAGVTRPVVCPLDTMQLRILDLVQAGQDVLVGARPGTGRTSLRSALVADAVSSGRTVLVAAAEGPVRRQVGAVVNNWSGSSLPVAWEVARTRQEQAVQHAQLVAGLETMVAGGEPSPVAAQPGAVSSLGRAVAGQVHHVTMLHEKRHPWGVSVNDLHQRLAALATQRPAPTVTVPLEDHVVQGITVADLPGLQSRVVELAQQGAWAVRSQENPWFGVQSEDAEDAERLLAVAGRLSGGALEGMREVLAPIAAALGVGEVTTLAEAQRLLRLARGVRLAVRRFGSDVFEEDLARWAAAHRDGASGLQAARVRKRVRSLLQARGTEPAEGPAAAVAQAADTWRRLQAWPGRPADAPVQPVGAEVTEATDRVEAVSLDLVWFQNHLAEDSGQDLARTDLDELQERMGRLSEQPERAAALPEVTPRWRELVGRGLGPVLQEFARRGTPAERVADELEHVWLVALLELLTRQEPALATFDRDEAERSVRALDEVVQQNQAEARAAVARAVHAARSAVGRTRRAAALLEAARRDGPWSLAEWWRRAPDVMRALTPVLLVSPWAAPQALPVGARADLALVDRLPSLSPARAAAVLGRADHLVALGDTEVDRPVEPEPSTPGQPVAGVPGDSAWEVLARRVPQLVLGTAWRPLSADLEPPVPGRTPLAAVPGREPSARTRHVVAQEAVPQEVWRIVREALSQPSGTQSVLVTTPTDAEARWWQQHLSAQLAGDHYTESVRQQVQVRPWRRSGRSTADVVVVLADGHGELLGERVTRSGSAADVLPVLRRAVRRLDLVVTRSSDEELRAARAVPDSAGGLLTRWFDAPAVATRVVPDENLPPLCARFVRRLRAEGMVVRPVHHAVLGWMLHVAPGRDRPEITTVLFDEPVTHEGTEVDAHVRVWPAQLRRAGWMVEQVSSLDLHRDLGREAMRVRNAVLRAAVQQVGRGR